MKWWLCAALALMITGCGVPSTGVVGAGEPATGITTGLRLYYVAEGRLRGIPQDVRLDSLDAALKLLLDGPDAMKTSNTGGAKPNPGRLVSRLVINSTFHAVGRKGKVTVTLPDTELDQLSGLAMGQLVCTLASAQAQLRGGSPADVEVTVIAKKKRSGPSLCSQFRNA